MHHRERFDPRRIPQPTLLHIGTAAGALILGIALSTDPRERAVASRCLFSLAELVHAMSPTYRPAELMSNMLDNVLKEPWWEFNSAPNLEKSVAPRIPPRREESDNDRFGLSFQPQPGNPDMFLDVDQPINGLDIEFCSPPVSPPTGMGSPLQQINGADVPRHQIAFNSMYYWDMSDLDQAAASSNFLTETIGG
jgi:hypothetical protein